MLPDAGIKDYTVRLESKELTEVLCRNLNEAGFPTKVVEQDEMYRVGGGAIIGQLIRKSGFTGFKRQVDENICFPKWVYRTRNKDFHKALVAGIIESEGSAPTLSERAVRISQSTSIESIDYDRHKEYETPTGCNIKIIAKEDLGSVDRSRIEGSPPILLLSVRRLIRKYGIESQLNLDSVSITENNTSARWNLSVTGEDIRRLYEFSEDYLVSKKNQFERYFEGKQERHADKGEREDFYIEGVKELYEKNGYVTSEMLADHLNRAENTARNSLSMLEDEGLVRCAGVEEGYKSWVPIDT